ncbi:MAG: DUF3617 domain-containing protein [Polyangia bacterium]|jgi:hypothetical protein
MKKLLVVLAALLLIPVIGYASQKLMMPGMWQVTVTVEMTGMPFKMPPQTASKCLKPEDVKDPKELIAQNQKNKDCQISNLKEVGNKVSWSMVCKGQHGAGSGTGEMIFSHDTYHGTIQMKLTDPNGQPHDMTEHVSGKRTGDCS